MASIGFAFLAGVLSFLSPCVLPLIPLYLAFLTGTAVNQLAAKTPRRLIVLHALLFIAGFSLIFIALGASASVLGVLLFKFRVWIERLGGLFLAVLGLWMLGVLKVGFLYREARFHFNEKPAGLAGSVMVGAAFGAGWTPCVGPILTGTLLMAAKAESMAKGVLLLSAYSLGFGLPMFLCALGVERASKVLDRIKPALPWIERATGVLLFIVGLALAAGWYRRFGTWSISLFPGWVQLSTELGL
ncbi:cytochrome c biogenesis CcdA family protein [Elusimicrobiota bacterium]